MASARSKKILPGSDRGHEVTRRDFLRFAACAVVGVPLSTMAHQTMRPDFSALLGQYRGELLDRTVPFWLGHGMDWENGGICTVLSDDGAVVSRDKYMWSQLRAIWTFSALYNRIERRTEWLDAARHIYEFAKRFGRDGLGNWVFSVDRDGKPLQGATSIYADGFAIGGLTEYAKATGSEEAIRLARETYHNVRERLAHPGTYPTEPLPVPAGCKAHGISMIFAKAFHDLGSLLDDAEICRAGLDHAGQVMDIFRRPERRRVYEFVRLDNSLWETPPGTAVVPGHAIEAMWFMIHIFRRLGDRERVRQAIECIRWHIELGWDDECGGIRLARDAAGTFWADKEDTKIWWPHAEALYALLLAHSIVGEPWCMDWFTRVHDYSFGHFPSPHGEWIQRLDRRGKRIDNIAAMPVKDPFHLARSLIYCIGALQRLSAPKPNEIRDR